MAWIASIIAVFRSAAHLTPPAATASQESVSAQELLQVSHELTSDYKVGVAGGSGLPWQYFPDRSPLWARVQIPLWPELTCGLGFQSLPNGVAFSEIICLGFSFHI